LAARTAEPSQKITGSLSEAVERLRAAGANALPITANLALPEDRVRVVDTVREELGPLDVLVNNAAATFLEPVEDLTTKHFELMMELQVRAPLHLSQLALHDMKAKRSGWILNITSRAAVHPPGPPYDPVHATGGFTGYGMCKSALERLTTGMAAEHYS